MSIWSPSTLAAAGVSRTVAAEKARFVIVVVL
jgi:hypothetical protein